MSKKYLAFLGANAYKLSTYIFREQPLRTPYVQAALTRILCQDWTANDRILVFTTPKAREKNWGALSEEFQRLCLPCPHTQIDIPEGGNEESLWEIFDTVLQTMEPGDDIIFDVTYGFRSLPMLALIILNYAKFVKNCALAGMYYGAYEARQAPQGKPDATDAEYETPVIDLTPLVNVLDWTVGIDRFLNTGDASVVTTLTEKQVYRILKKTRDHNKQEAENLKAMARALSNFAKNCATCRGKELSPSALQVKHYIETSLRASDELIKPLTPLLEKIQAHFTMFNPDDEIRNIFHVVSWCREHHLIQQSITILEEGLITDFCHKLGLNPDDYRKRQAVSAAISFIAQSKRPEARTKPGKNCAAYVAPLFSLLPSEKFISNFDRLRNMRNDINHAGYIENYQRADKFQKAFDEIFEEIQQELLVNETWDSVVMRSE
ncbi:CRISPR-associated protein, TM1812 family [Candidatus Vecturithrix granuli]|uniref:CRISPR-associated protein, TM1812 family n=1 Tax=Vecturithrix granuli TaxID=1499967 RepID=A0A081CAL9_VECG1|nr:CRISPR-associated protein, TM1812 family [Candidatus Vecturithrix granuli]